MTDAQRIEFLACLMDASVRRSLFPEMFPEAEATRINRDSAAIFNRYELHRRSTDTPTAFRLAIDDAANAPRSS